MTETTQAAPEELPMVQLQISDIENAVKVIDFASEQGAFKGWNTINEVMAIRNKLVMFLHAVTPPAEQTEAEATSSTPTEGAQ